MQLAQAPADSATGTATRVGYDAMRLTLARCQRDLIDWRCSLPLDQVVRLRGSTDGWDCSDMKLFVGQVAFLGAPKSMQKRLNAIPTRLRLDTDLVDLTIKAGRIYTRNNPQFMGLLCSLKPSITAPR